MSKVYKEISMEEKDINDRAQFNEFQEIVKEVYSFTGSLNSTETRDLIHRFEVKLDFYLKNKKYIKVVEKQTQILSALDLYLLYSHYFNENMLFSKEKAFNLIQLGFSSIEEALDGMVDDILHDRVNPFTRGVAMVDILTDEQLEYLVHSIIKRYRELDGSLVEDSFHNFMGSVSRSGNFSEDFLLKYIKYFDVIELKFNTDQEKTASIELLIEHMLKN